jgi:two-component system, NarL family, nitrate/nitrite response regulator NarL
LRGKPGTRSRLGYPSVLIGNGSAKLRAQWRAGLRGAYAVEEAWDRDTLERLLSTFAPDILLLDLDLPHLTGVADVQSLQALGRGTWIVVLSKSPNEWEGLSVLKAGARGYCGKDIDPLLLRKVVDRVHEGEIWAERRLIPRLMEEYASRPDDLGPRAEGQSDGRLDALTAREQEIARLVGAGASNKDIASQLNIGEGTVKAHLTSTFRKLGLADRLGLGLYMQKV